MSSLHPYRGLPDHQFWRKEPGIADPATFDPVVRAGFAISARDAVVTAGSCFAQHVARFLADNGFKYLVTESLDAAIDPGVARAFNYGLFPARYGNVYTARQLRQLIERAYGLFSPIVQVWENAAGEVVDPFRPQIQPGGFLCAEELAQDRKVHLAAVRRAFEEMDIFVFTLGLTEAWLDGRDGAVYPLAPGVAGGDYDPGIHQFHNFTVEETVRDLQWSIDFIRARNPDVRIVVTVSPVPLNATALDRHVFTSTTYSKAVLRIAAEQICTANPACDYFPSYEVITSPFARGAYYAEDCREVRQEGVQHVMSLFLKHYAGVVTGAEQQTSARAAGRAAHLPAAPRTIEGLLQTLCDEEAITNE